MASAVSSNRHQRVGPVDLIDVDVIGSQPAQRVFDLSQDSRSAGVAEYSSALPLKPHLGRDEHARAKIALGECLADDFLRATKPIGRSGIDETDAMIDRFADGRDGFRLIGSAPHPTADRPRS